MPKRDQLSNSFTAGQLDPEMVGRSDTEIYNAGAARVVNWRQLVHGGLSTRDGFLLANELDRFYRLLPFIFSEDQAYIVGIGSHTGGGDNNIRIWDEQGTEVAALEWAGVAFPRQIRWTQRFDTGILTFDPLGFKRLLRTGATSFTLEDFTFETDAAGRRFCPYFKFGQPGDRYQFTTGQTQVQSLDNPIFAAGDVGAKMRLVEEGQADPLIYSEVEITSFVDANNVGVGAIVAGPAGAATLPDSTPTINWRIQAVGFTKGYPRSVQFHGQRLWLGGTTLLPTHMIGSITGGFFNFETGEGLDTDAVFAPLAADQVNEIEHLASGRFLTILCDQANYFVPETDEQPITPALFNPKFVSRHGASNRVRPQRYDDQIVYVQDKGRAIRAVTTEPVTQRLEQIPISLVSSNLIDATKDAATLYAIDDRPEEYSVFINKQGDMPVYHSVKTENIRGWSQWTHGGGEPVSIAAVNEFLVLCVLYQGNYHLEIQSRDVTVDSAEELTNPTPKNDWVSDRFKSIEVDVVADAVDPDNPSNTLKNGYYLGKVTTDSNGNFNLPQFYASTRVVIGFAFESLIEMLPVALVRGDGSDILMDPKRVTDILVQFNSTLAAEVQGNELVLRQVNDDFSKPPELFTGIKRFYSFGWDREGRVVIRVPQPLPATILAVKRNVVFA